jgi:hypothetical protein
MTLAVGFKFEHPKAAGVSPVLLLSDSRYSYSRSTGEVYRDDGMKIWTLAKNVFAAFAGDVLVAQRALERVKRRLAQSSSGSFDDLKSILKSSFDSTLTDGDPQQPHCLLAVMASDGSSKLFYARPGAARYEVIERTKVVIGLESLEPILREKINQPARHGGLGHPNHFMMALPGRVFRNDDDRQQCGLSRSAPKRLEPPIRVRPTQLAFRPLGQRNACRYPDVHRQSRSFAAENQRLRRNRSSNRLC